MKLSMTESRATLARPAKRHQTITAFHQASKSGGHQHHAKSKKPLDALLQNGRTADTIQTGAKPAGDNILNNLSSAVQRQHEVRRKAAVAAQDRQRAASRKEKDAAWGLASDSAKIAAARKRLEDHRAEQNAFIDRAPTAARTSTSRPAGNATLLGAAPTRPRPAAPTRPFPRPNTTKQPPSILGRIGADAKRARESKEGQEREVKARKEQLQAASDDTTETRAQQEAEANHAIRKPSSYQSLRTPNTIPNANHGLTERPYEPLRTNSKAPEASNDAKPQADADDELVLEPNPQPQGPFSLNSAAGIRALQKSITRPPPMNLPFDDVPTQSATQRFMGTPKTKFSFKKPSKNNDYLPISISDLKLYQWRADKINWAEVRELYSDFTGITPLRSEDSLRTRLRQVSKAIEIEEISQELCEQVIEGDEEAAAELNRLAGLYAGLPVSAANSAGTTSLPFRKIVKQTPAPRGMTVPPPPAPAAPRPMQGGKTLDHDTYMELLTSVRDAYATDDDDDDEEDREGSPLAEEDCIHWEYYMERRDLSSDDFENELEDIDDELQWREYNASFDHVGYANSEACHWIFTVPEGTAPIFRPAEEWKLTHVPLEEGMAAFRLKTAYGLVEVRVSRRMLTFQDHLMPETKQGWLSKTLYGVFVKKKKSKATVNDDDDESPAEVEIESYQVNDAVYGSLDQANQEAMEEWLKLTVRPSSANLSEFACKRQEARQELQRELEDAGDGVFFRKVMEDDERTVEVFAKKLIMKGPRN